MAVEVTDGVVNALQYYIDTTTGDIVPMQLQKSGGVVRIPVVSDEMTPLLYDVLKELRVMSAHLAVMTGEKLTYTDMEN